MPKYLPTANQIKDLLSYDPTTGSLTWRVDRRPRTKAGDEAGTVTSAGRVVVGVNNYPYAATHIIWVLVTGHWPAARVFCRDGNPQNLRWDNLSLRRRRLKMTYGAQYHRGIRALNARAVELIGKDAYLARLYAQGDDAARAAMRQARAIIRNFDRKGIKHPALMGIEIEPQYTPEEDEAFYKGTSK